MSLTLNRYFEDRLSFLSSHWWLFSFAHFYLIMVIPSWAVFGMCLLYLPLQLHSQA